VTLIEYLRAQLLRERAKFNMAWAGLGSR